MEKIWVILMFAGLAAGLLSQIYIIVQAFKIRFSAGLSCLIITPIYALVSDLREEQKIRNAAKIWVLGFVVFFLSMVLLSA